MSIQDQGTDGNDNSGPDTEQSVLRLVDAVVLLDILITEPIVEEMPPGFCEENTDHWSKEQEGSCGVAEQVRRWLDELGY